MKKWKLIGIGLLAVVVLIVILQNRQPVQTKLLFATVTMPRALLLAVALLVGFGLGIGTSLVIGRRRAKSEGG